MTIRSLYFKDLVESIPGKGKSKCKDMKAGMSLISGSIKNTSVVLTQSPRERLEGNDTREAGRDLII